MGTQEAYDWIIEQASKSYEYERENTNKIRERVGFIISFLMTPIGGAIVSLIATFKGDTFEGSNLWLFTFPIIISSILLIFALSKILFFLGTTKKYAIPIRPNNLLAYFRDGSDAETSILDSKISYADSLAIAYDSALENNTARIKDLIFCQRLAIFAVPLILICSVKHLHASRIHEKDVLEVRILNDISRLEGIKNVQQIIEYHRPAACNEPPPRETKRKACSKAKQTPASH